MPSRLVEFADHYWSEYLRKIVAAVEPLSDEQVVARANERSNSIANLLAHLHGNLSQWVLAGLGGEPFERHRSEEFAGTIRGDKAALLRDLSETVRRCREVVRTIPPEEFARVRRIQRYELDGTAALFHAVEHMSYHTGQIVLLAKAMGVEVDFYPQHRGE
ncbi:MAG: DinB family protein [Thermoanaerobaculia bacterium]